MEFLKSNIGKEWIDLVEEFPEFIFDLSPYVESWFGVYTENAKKYNLEVVDKKDLCNLRYGFECGVGWKELVREYFTEVRRLVLKAKSNGHDIHYRTFIFKEKFGEIRDQGDFYGDDRSLYIQEFYKIGDILYESILICEKCGDIGSLRTDSGWYKTRCDKHDAERSRV